MVISYFFTIPDVISEGKYTNNFLENNQKQIMFVIYETNRYNIDIYIT